MTAASLNLGGVMDIVGLLLGVAFLWSTLVLLLGLSIRRRVLPKADRKLRFAVLICARNEERVIRLPVKSILMTSYPKELRDVIVLADNCSDGTAQKAREAGATVWEKTVPSHGKGDVLKWGIDRVRASGRYDAVAVFDADNIVSADWFTAMNDALNAGENIVTGRRLSSNATTNAISGWYTVYWDLMNELSNRVRTNIGLSSKLTGTGFAFRLEILGDEGWTTRSMVEDVEFTVISNIAGRRVCYVPEAEYADEQPVSLKHMWRQLCRWETGCWQVIRYYFFPWLRVMFRSPSMRLFDSFFALLTGMSVAFFILHAFIRMIVRLSFGESPLIVLAGFSGAMLFVSVVGWLTAFAAVSLSSRKRRPTFWAIITFPIFSFILSATAIWSLIFPTRTWKPIPHGN